MCFNLVANYLLQSVCTSVWMCVYVELFVFPNFDYGVIHQLLVKSFKRLDAVKVHCSCIYSSKQNNNKNNDINNNCNEILMKKASKYQCEKQTENAEEFFKKDHKNTRTRSYSDDAWERERERHAKILKTRGKEKKKVHSKMLHRNAYRIPKNNGMKRTAIQQQTINMRIPKFIHVKWMCIVYIQLTVCCRATTTACIERAIWSEFLCIVYCAPV